MLLLVQFFWSGGSRALVAAVPPGRVMAGKFAGRKGVEGDKKERRIKGIRVIT